MKKTISSKDKTKEKSAFWTVASIIGLIVDVKALWDMLPIVVYIDGTISILPTPKPIVIFKLGDFEMTGELFTGFVWLLFIITSIFAMTLFLKNSYLRPETTRELQLRLDKEYLLLLSFRRNEIKKPPLHLDEKKTYLPLMLYSQLVIGLTLLWFFTFHPITDIHIIFLIILGWLAPIVFAFLNYAGRIIEKIFKSSQSLAGGFVKIAAWIGVAFFEVGFFKTNTWQGFLFPVIAIAGGILQVAIMNILLSLFFETLINLE